LNADPPPVPIILPVLPPPLPPVTYELRFNETYEDWT